MEEKWKQGGFWEFDDILCNKNAKIDQKPPI